MPEQTITHPLPEDTVVKITGPSQSGDPELDGIVARVGQEYEVRDYCPPGEGDDPNGRAYYLLDDEHTFGGGFWAYPEHVAVVRTAVQQANREVPSLLEMTKGVSNGLHSIWGDVDFEIDETEVSGGEDEPYVYAYGKTGEGLRFSAKIAVLRIDPTDF